MNQMYAMRRATFSACFLLSIAFSYAATFSVTNTNDSGPGSLRQAMLDANSTPGADIIVFNITGTGPFLISPLSALPAITEGLTISGYSQEGSVIGPIATRTIQIVLNGASAGNASGFAIDASNVTISGLAIHSFQQNGINVFSGGDNLWFWGNFIGTDAGGTTDLGNGNHGINLNDGGTGNSDGVIIGTNSDGTNDTGEGNLVSGNGQDGILGWTLTNSLIAGNIIGGDRNGGGTTMGNGRNGILLTVNSSANRIGSNGNTINDAEESNRVILNNGRGIYLAANSNTNAIAGNIVGLNATGGAAGNAVHGIEILNSTGNRVGVDVSHVNFAAERNTISSNLGNGIYLTSQSFFGFDFNTATNTIAGNYIGTTAADESRGNGLSGVALNAQDGLLTTDNVIGSNNDGVSDAAEGNVIAYNSIIGIGTTADPNINGNKFSRNSTYSNANLGIDLGGNGVTPNDNGDADTGPNEYYNFPVISGTAKLAGNTLTVRGVVGASSIVEVYLNDGSGEGRTFLFRAQEGTTLNGIADIATGDSTYSDPVYTGGAAVTEALFQFNVPLSQLPTVPAGASLVALAIKPAVGDSSTSEFGPALAVLPVSIVVFQGNLADGVVKLSWTTSREENLSHFVIEKSVDGVNYTSIGEIQGGAARGQYIYVDKTALGKINYYRLKAVDQDGRFAYSRIINIRNDGSLIVLKLTPNPVINNLNVSFRTDKNEPVRIVFYDQMGRPVKRYNVQAIKGLNAFNLTDLRNLPSGNYTVEVVGETISAREKIVVQ